MYITLKYLEDWASAASGCAAEDAQILAGRLCNAEFEVCNGRLKPLPSTEGRTVLATIGSEGLLVVIVMDAFAACAEGWAIAALAAAAAAGLPAET